MRRVLWCVAVAAASLGLGCAPPAPEEIAWHLVDSAPLAGDPAPVAGTASPTPPGQAPSRPPAAGRLLRGPARAVIDDDMRYTFPRAPQLLVARDAHFAMPDAEYFAMDVALPRLLPACDRLLVQVASQGKTARDARWVVGTCDGAPPNARLRLRAPTAPVLRGTTADVWVQVRPVPEQRTERRRFALDRVTPHARLMFGYGVESPGWEAGAPPVDFTVGIEGETTPLFSTRLDPAREPAQRRWFDASLDLSRYGGSSIVLTLETRIAAPDASAAPTVPVWGDPVVVVPQQAPHAGPHNLLLVSIDTLRAGSVSAYGRGRPTTPFLDALAREGALFERVVAQSTITPVSHMSLFTGLYPREHGVTDLRQPSNLIAYPMMAEVFRANGYATGAVTEDGLLQAALGFERGFDRYVENKSPDLGSTVGHVESTFDAALAWLGAHRGQRWFLFVHTYQVHAPYTPPPAYQGVFGGTRDVDRYEEEIRYTDDQLRRLWQTVTALGIADDTLLVVTSDHGEEFGEHGALDHGSHLYDETLLVPLVMRAPGVIPARLRVAEAVGLIDVFPTVARILGLPSLFFRDAWSLTPLFDADRSQGEALRWMLARRPLFAEAWAATRMLVDHTLDPSWSPPLYAVREGARKVIWTPPAPAAGRPGRLEMYDLAGDRAEQQPIAAGRAAAFKGEIDALHDYAAQAMSAGAAAAPAARPPQALDPATAEKLRALGYVR
ncbi:MAG TPA: sulfatase [Candidatus Binatia bacterium]|jgi:arylsulfatase A-like enzyme